VKRLFPILFLFSALLRLDGALTVTDRGSLALSSNSTTIAFTPTSTLTAGTTGVMLYSTRNPGALGSAKNFTQTTFNDSVGNTWTLRLNTIYDPGAASAGEEVAVYTAPIVTNVNTTTDNITVTMALSTSPRRASCYEVSGLNGTPTYVASGGPDLAVSGQATTAVSMTTGTITTGDVVICVVSWHDNTAMSAFDSDTTNGTWSTGLEVGIGAVVGRQGRQYKIVTGTATQTWDVTLGVGVAWQPAWIQLREAVLSQSATNGFFILAR
jgi:hypothetical protein